MKQTATGELFLFVRLSPSAGGIVTFGGGAYYSLQTDVDEDGDPVNNGLSQPEYVAAGGASPEHLARCIEAMCTGALEGYVYRYRRGATDIPPQYGEWALHELQRLDPSSQFLGTDDSDWPGGAGSPQTMGAPHADTRVCPYCAETIKKAAIKCRYCQSSVTPTT